MKKLLMAAVGALSLVAAMAGVANAAEPDPRTLGEPIVGPHSPYGYYIWMDGDRVHVLTTDGGGDPARYTGVITTDTVIRNVDVARPEDGDWAVASGDTLQFHFFTAGHVDGVHFTAPGSHRLTFRLYRNGHLIRTDHIFLGAAGFHPAGNPFSVIN
jgi:hypothetical protein